MSNDDGAHKLMLVHLQVLSHLLGRRRTLKMCLNVSEVQMVAGLPDSEVSKVEELLQDTGSLN